MRVRPFAPAFILLALFAVPGLARAQKLDKEDRAFLDAVRPLLTAEEDKLYRSLKEKGDRAEFQKIFWARRDPDLATPENEYQAEYEKLRAEADRLYRVPVMAGSHTDCGRVHILLGKPDEVQQEGGTIEAGMRVPETWTYRDRPGRTFSGGKAQIAFDQECRAPGALGPQMDRVAASLVLQPSLEYKRGKDGRLVKLVDLLPRDTAARALFKQPRQDFPVGVQASFLKVADGGTALLGLLRGEAAGLSTADGPGGKTATLSVAASAVADDGRETGWTEQTMSVPVAADGSFLASFKLALRPGKYTLKAGAVDTKGGKASLGTLPIEAPDFAKVETAADGSTTPLPSAGSVILVRSIEDLGAGTADDPAHPFAAFVLGPLRLQPFFGGSFAKTDEVNIVFQVYDVAVDKVTGKADATATLSILKDGKTPVAKLDQPIETAVGGGVIGPVPLSGYAPGPYVVRLKVTDRLGKRDVVQDAPFEVKP